MKNYTKHGIIQCKECGYIQNIERQTCQRCETEFMTDIRLIPGPYKTAAMKLPKATPGQIVAAVKSGGHGNVISRYIHKARNYKIL